MKDGMIYSRLWNVFDSLCDDTWGPADPECAREEVLYLLRAIEADHDDSITVERRDNGNVWIEY